MATKISFNLSVSSIQNAIKEVQAYKNSLNAKCEELCRQLIAVGYAVALQKINESPIGNTVVLNSALSPSSVGCKAILMAVGQTKQADGYAPVNTLLLLEFGSGIHFNPVPNPMADKFGMGVGTFPDQTHAFEDGGWYFLGTDDKWHHSYGVKATMPMYSAIESMKNHVLELAKGVFRT